MTRKNATLADFSSGRFGACKIAVLVPCYNEEKSVGKVVNDFRAALPTATILVYDNNSTDNTTRVARAAGAEVLHEARQGKGFVVRRMFADVDADIYVMVDGDATYDAPSVRRMIGRLLEKQLDMVVGARVDRDVGAYRAGHRAGNKAADRFRGTHVRLQSSTTCCRGIAFCRAASSSRSRCCRADLRSRLNLPCMHLYWAWRWKRSIRRIMRGRRALLSKLNTWRDGLRILRTIGNLYRAEHPLPFFTGIGLVLALISVGLAIPIVTTFLETGLVPRLPTAVLSTGLMLLAFLSAAVGLILDTVTRGRRELKLLAYLSHDLPAESVAAQTRGSAKSKAVSGLKSARKK